MKINHWVFLIASVMLCMNISISAETEEVKRQQACCSQAKRELEEARRLYEKAEYSKAIKHYGLAMKMLEGVPSDNSLRTESVQGIAECLYRVALSENITGHRDSARELLKKAADMNHSKARALLSRWDSESGTQKSVVSSSGEARQYVNTNPAHKAGEVKSVLLPGGKGMDFVWCPPGQFIKDGKRVIFKEGFWIGKYEVSEREYKSVFGDSSLRESRGDWYPVECELIDALMFIDEVNRHAEYDLVLPSSSQWEYAAIAGEKLICDYSTVWCRENSNGTVHEVGKKNPNKWGIFDMCGNISEWCYDLGDGKCTNDSRNEKVIDESGRELPKAEATDLIDMLNMAYAGVYEEPKRIVRGGTFKTPLQKCKLFDSEYDRYSKFYRPTGFRLCLMENKDAKRMPRIGKLPLFVDHDKAIKQLQTACEKYNFDFVPEISSSILTAEDIKWILSVERNYKFNLEAIPDAHRHKAVKELSRIVTTLRKIYVSLAESARIAQAYGVDLRGPLPKDFEGDDDWPGFSAVVRLPKQIEQLMCDKCLWLRLTTDVRGRMESVLLHISQVIWKKELRAKMLSCEGTEFEKLRLKIESERPVDVNQLNQVIFHSNDIAECFNAVYQKYRKCFVNVAAGNMRGSGFVCNVDGDYYLYTNKHVLDGGKPFFATMEDGTHLKFDMLQIAQNLDVARCRLRNVPDNMASWLELRQRPPDMNEDIAVIGNSDGAGVQTILKGKIIGIGPAVFEISAEIVHGNSGSPVLDRLGNVIGIATFAVDGSATNDSIKQDTRFAGVRRFAIKLTPAIQWQNVNPNQYLRSRGK